jgi:hypothetical protein
MRLVAAIVVLALVAAGCGDAAPVSPPASAAASTAPSEMILEPAAVNQFPGVRIVSGHLVTAASLRVIELAGTPCVREREVELDIGGLPLEGAAAALPGAEGFVLGGRAYVATSRRSAAVAFGAIEVLLRTDGRSTAFIARAAGIEGVADGALIAWIMLPIELSDGRSVWLRGSYVASIPCPTDG